jgi:hypothetical protein
MCFVATKNQRPKIASEDIVCWKALKRRLTKKGYGAAFNNTIHAPFYYQPGENQPLIILKKIHWLANEYNINEGYHSYMEEEKAKCNKGRDEKVFKFIIPKGTKYYQNIFDCEYVSETIIMVG